MKHAAACVSPFLASEWSIIDSRSGRDSYCLTREVTHRNRGSCYLASPAAFRRIQIHVESAWFFVTNCKQRSPSPNTRGAIVAVLLVRARPPGGGISKFAWNSARRGELNRHGWDSNPRPSDYNAGALPLSHLGPLPYKLQRTSCRSCI